MNIIELFYVFNMLKSKIYADENLLRKVMITFYEAKEVFRGDLANKFWINFTANSDTQKCWTGWHGNAPTAKLWIKPPYRVAQQQGIFSSVNRVSIIATVELCHPKITRTQSFQVPGALRDVAPSSISFYSSSKLWNIMAINLSELALAIYAVLILVFQLLQTHQLDQLPSVSSIENSWKCWGM